MMADTDECYLFNRHGDVTGITDMSGNPTKDYEYDAFGNETETNTNDINLFRYCGEYYDEEIGYIYLRARYYNPEIVGLLMKILLEMDLIGIVIAMEIL